jgi:hypothetical protein
MKTYYLKKEFVMSKREKSKLKKPAQTEKHQAAPGVAKDPSCKTDWSADAKHSHGKPC